MNENIRKLKGANMDIDLATPREISHGSKAAVRGTKQTIQPFTGVLSRVFQFVLTSAGSNIWIPFCVLIQMKIRFQCGVEAFKRATATPPSRRRGRLRNKRSVSTHPLALPNRAFPPRKKRLALSESSNARPKTQSALRPRC